MENGRDKAMRGENGLLPLAPASGQELQEGLRLLEESQAFLRLILAGLALQYASLDVQRQNLLEPEACAPDPQNMQIGASLLTLCALFGFQRQAEALAEQGQASDCMDVKLGATSILITLIRFLRLVGEPSFRGEGSALAETELLSEPVE